MNQLTLSNKAKKALEHDYFKAMLRRITLETKRDVLSNEIIGVQAQLDGLEGMLGYKPTMAAPSVESEAGNE